MCRVCPVGRGALKVLASFQAVLRGFRAAPARSHVGELQETGPIPSWWVKGHRPRAAPCSDRETAGFRGVGHQQCARGGGPVRYCGWTKSISHHFEAMANHLFVGIDRGIKSF